jgi:hypothetical protein
MWRIPIFCFFFCDFFFFFQIFFFLPLPSSGLKTLFFSFFFFKKSLPRAVAWLLRAQLPSFAIVLAPVPPMLLALAYPTLASIVNVAYFGLCASGMAGRRAVATGGAATAAVNLAWGMTVYLGVP